jgi:AraC-like DNA-binding protein
MVDMHGEDDPTPARGTVSMASVAAERRMTRAMLRLAEVACADTEWSALGVGALDEVYYWALRGDAGAMLRARVTRGASVGPVARAVRFIESHLGEGIDVAAIAKAAAMCPTNLHARFRDVMAESPMQFVKRRRLEQALARVATGESVTEVALAIGYASLSHFSRDFRRHFGMPPSQIKGSRRPRR